MFFHGGAPSLACARAHVRTCNTGAAVAPAYKRKLNPLFISPLQIALPVVFISVELEGSWVEGRNSTLIRWDGERLQMPLDNSSKEIHITLI